MKKLLLFVMVLMGPLLFIYGCGSTDDLLTKTEKVDVTLDSFPLTYAPPAGLVAEFTTGDNPSCGFTSLNSLLAENPTWNDIVDRVERIGIDEVRYRVSNNLTAVPVAGRLSLTDPDTGSLTVIGESAIEAFTDVPEWTPLPFAEGGRSIVNHYLSNRDSGFEYCVEGDPNDASLSKTIEIQLGVDVTVELL